jgi:DNA-directed RNA polymerase I subunit RPA2
MTIGMLVESMAGKAGAMHGRWQDSTPFVFNERQRAVDYFGEQLESCGYSYYGSEPMYSGVAGTELHVHIYVGIVYYQRLRHMVSDKFQVRSMGPINNLPRQPLKGRKRKGGIRFGEMERDSLLAHGVSYLLHDRLMNCSDRHVATVCTNCGSILSPVAVPRETEQGGFDPDAALAASEASTAAQTSLMPATAAVQKVRQGASRQVERGMKHWCLSCDTGRYCVNMALPYVFRYLANELSGMGVRLTLDVTDEASAAGRIAGGSA